MRAVKSAQELDAEIFAEAIRPDPDLTVTEWAERYRILSSESSAEPGPWRTDRVPYAREIMDALSISDPTQEVTFVAGTQVGKTEIGNNFIGYIVDWAPGPVMMVYPTSNTGKRSSRTRLAKMIDATPRLRAKISDRRRDRSNSASLKEFPGGVLVIAGSNSAAELKSMPVRYLFEDELDEYPEDVDGQGPAWKLAEKRTDTFAAKKIFRASTPTVRGVNKIWGHLERSDWREYHVPCPHCEHPQVLRWEQFRWERRVVWEVVHADTGEVVQVPEGTEGAQPRETDEIVAVWYECASCRGRIEERHKAYMLPRGRWVARQPHVSGHRGYHLPSYYSPIGWCSWRQIVADRLAAERDPSGELLRTWQNTVAAEPFLEAAEQIDAIALRGRADAYRLGTVPSGGLLLTAGVDVQADRLEVIVRAWGRDEESWLVAWERIYGDTETAAPWRALDQFLQQRFAHESGARLRVLASGVDAGYRTQTVYDFCRTRLHRGVFALRGQSQRGKSILGLPTAQEVTHRGVRIPNGVKLWPVGVDTAKARIHARLRLTEPGPGCMHFPADLPTEYYEQLAAERQVKRYRRGYVETVWEKDAGARNEALDLEVYAYAAALFAGVTRANWDRIEAALRATAGDLFVAAEERAASDAAEAAEARPESAERVARDDAQGQGAQGATAPKREDQSPTPRTRRPAKPVWAPRVVSGGKWSGW